MNPPSKNLRELFRRAFKAAKTGAEKHRIAKARDWLDKGREPLVVMLHLMLSERGPR